MKSGWEEGPQLKPPCTYLPSDDIWHLDNLSFWPRVSLYCIHTNSCIWRCIPTINDIWNTNTVGVFSMWNKQNTKWPIQHSMNYTRHKYGVVQKYKHDASGFSAWWWPSRVHAGPSGGRGGCSIMLHLPHLLSTTNTNIQVYKYTDAKKKNSVGRY